ncbi:hypothetical protein HELRODRAFT_162779 [Helobdella robusta]|uniref:Uncharacterized protein n=1 Tax=Helobdella robusta TaxID=6412 RepID=T1ET48_HELRO|nr:hypothetical protein HELRODRAFT_162779 [Helobdella robusta]ESN99261.1 hypothetical protein HELRODRAFT_162779 [Helobdella robusta]
MFTLNIFLNTASTASTRHHFRGQKMALWLQLIPRVHQDGWHADVAMDDYVYNRPVQGKRENVASHEEQGNNNKVDVGDYAVDEILDHKIGEEGSDEALNDDYDLDFGTKSDVDFKKHQLHKLDCRENFQIDEDVDNIINGNVNDWECFEDDTTLTDKQVISSALSHCYRNDFKNFKNYLTNCLLEIDNFNSPPQKFDNSLFTFLKPYYYQLGQRAPLFNGQQHRQNNPLIFHYFACPGFFTSHWSNASHHNPLHASFDQLYKQQTNLTFQTSFNKTDNFSFYSNDSNEENMTDHEKFEKWLSHSTNEFHTSSKYVNSRSTFHKNNFNAVNFDTNGIIESKKDNPSQRGWSLLTTTILIGLVFLVLNVFLFITTFVQWHFLGRKFKRRLDTKIDISDFENRLSASKFCDSVDYLLEHNKRSNRLDKKTLQITRPCEMKHERKNEGGLKEPSFLCNHTDISSSVNKLQSSTSLTNYIDNILNDTNASTNSLNRNVSNKRHFEKFYTIPKTSTNSIVLKKQTDVQNGNASIDFNSNCNVESADYSFASFIIDKTNYLTASKCNDLNSLNISTLNRIKMIDYDKLDDQKCKYNVRFSESQSVRQSDIQTLHSNKMLHHHCPQHQQPRVQQQQQQPNSAEHPINTPITNNFHSQNTSNPLNLLLKENDLTTTDELSPKMRPVCYAAPSLPKNDTSKCNVSTVV